MPKKLKGRRNVYGEISLFEAVDEYATNHNYNFSQVVTKALRRFLTQANNDEMRRKYQERIEQMRPDNRMDRMMEDELRKQMNERIEQMRPDSRMDRMMEDE